VQVIVIPPATLSTLLPQRVVAESGLLDLIFSILVSWFSAFQM
jgi:hypothetical protein